MIVLHKIAFNYFCFRYPKTISFAIEHFKACNLHALFIAANAPHRSAFNRVERRMAPLSRQLTGVILPHDTFGSHLDGSGKTVDTDLELKNFAAAGKVLAKLWSELVIDTHAVTAEYLEPTAVAAQPQTVPPEWYAKHVRESQYFLQVNRLSSSKFYLYGSPIDYKFMHILNVTDCKMRRNFLLHSIPQ